MARLLFEMQAVRTRRGPLAAGTAFVVYTDTGGTALADISATVGGSAIPGSTVTVADIAGLGPSALRFYGPTDATAVLYLRCPSDASLGVQELEADATGGGGVTDHGVLTGLTDDDHPQYSRAMVVADRGLFVSTTGNDSNDGLSPGRAKLTVQAALTALGTSGSGGTINVLGGEHVQTTELVATITDAKPIIVRGQGSALSNGGTRLRWSTDLGTGTYAFRTNDPQTYGFVRLEDLELLGPNNTVALGAFPANMDGVRLGRRQSVRDCLIRGFHAGVKIAADHNRLERVVTPGNGYGIYFNDMDTYGDHIIYDCDLSGPWIASIAIGNTGSIQGLVMLKGHLGFGPYGILIEDGTDAVNGLPIGALSMFGVAFEAVGNGAIVSPDMAARCLDLYFFSCGFSSYAAYKIAATSFPALVQVGTAERWQFNGGAFPSKGNGDQQPADALIKANTLKGMRVIEGDFIATIQAAITAGVTPFQAKIAIGNRFTDQSTRGSISKADNGPDILAGQVLSWAPQSDRDYLAPHATAQAGNADAGVAGVAFTGGPAINEATLQACVVMIAEGRQIRVLTDAATPALNTPLMVDPADRNKVAASDGRLDLPYLGFASSQSGTTSGTNCNIDLQIARATGVRRKTVTGSRGGNAALADLLSELSALGLITDSSSA